VLIELLRSKIVVDQVKCVISKYQQRLMEMSFVPSSCGRKTIGKDGDANELFLTYLFSDVDLGIKFLKDVGLIRSKEKCNTCGRDMTWWLTPNAKVLGGDVGEGLSSCARSPNLSSTVHGFSILTSLSRTLCFSHTTSYAANLPALSKKSIASVLPRSRTGAISA